MRDNDCVVDMLRDSESDVLLDAEDDRENDTDAEPVGVLLDVTERETDIDMLLDAVSEVDWVPDNVTVGVDGGVIVPVTDRV